MRLEGKKILLGVTGSIAAYKAVVLLRALQNEGAEVRVALTANAARFVGPLTFETLSRYPVFQDLWADGQSWVEHVHLAEWADCMVVAPCTANMLAKLSHGLTDDAVSALCLSARCPILLAPAMDLEMYQHKATQQNLAKAVALGYQVIEPVSGYLASGLEGQGRLAEPESLVQAVITQFQPKDLAGKTILISAGPTQEALDPVRYLSNHSTGKMGIAIAEEASRRGATVTLILGPSSLCAHQTHGGQLETIRVTTAEEMYQQMTQRQADADCIIMSAAVADFRPPNVAQEKIKKVPGEDTMLLKLTKTQDILGHLGTHKPQAQLLVGFALETNDEHLNARKKLYAKHLDLIIMNSLADPQAGFGYDTNRITVMDKHGAEEAFELKPKWAVAQDILKVVARHLAVNTLA